MDAGSALERGLLSKSNVTDRQPWRRYAPTLLAALLLVSLAVYLPPYKQHFIGDDFLQLGYIDGFLQQPAQVLRVFNPTWTTWYYRPLQNVWMLVGRLTFGLNPFPFYYLQGLWHLLAVTAVYATARKLRVNAAGALIATTLFALSAHHQDVVSWISSVAVIMVTTLSLLATACYLTYLRRPERGRWLVAATILTLLALLAHEEGVLLPIFLLALRVTAFRRRPRRLEAAAAAAILSLTATLIVVQFLRPNLTISLYDQSVAGYLAMLNPLSLANYLVHVAGRWLLLNKTIPGVVLLSAVTGTAFIEVLLAGAIVLGLGYWAGRRGPAVRLALLWAALHLGLLYVAVWTQKPELFAGRHLYAAWAALCVGLGHEAGLFLQRRGAARLRLVLFALAFLAGANVLIVGDDQRIWQQRALEVRRVERQMKQLLPEVTPRTQIYAHRFVLTPSFTPYAAAVWYNEPGLDGGSLSLLRQQEQVTRHTYLLDYAQDRVYNLMPAFQERARTRVLWQEPTAELLTTPEQASAGGSFDAAVVAGPPGARRLALRVQPPDQGWLSLIYTDTVPAGSQFAVDVWGPPGTTFRSRLVDEAGQEHLLFRTTAADGWQALRVPLREYGGRRVTLHLDVMGSPDGQAFWTQPRFVVD